MLSKVSKVSLGGKNSKKSSGNRKPPTIGLLFLQSMHFLNMHVFWCTYGYGENMNVYVKGSFEHFKYFKLGM